MCPNSSLHCLFSPFRFLLFKLFNSEGGKEGEGERERERRDGEGRRMEERKEKERKGRKNALFILI